MAGALSGIRVVELATGVAGLMAAMLLADSGADVHEVEPPTGGDDRIRPGFAMWGRAWSADVVTDNYRPGVAGRLGVTYEQLRPLKPDVISMSVTAFGESGPLRDEAGRPVPIHGGPDFRGPSSADRFYRASDGWIRVQAMRRKFNDHRRHEALPVTSAKHQHEEQRR